MVCEAVAITIPPVRLFPSRSGWMVLKSKYQCFRFSFLRSPLGCFPHLRGGLSATACASHFCGSSPYTRGQRGSGRPRQLERGFIPVYPGPTVPWRAANMSYPVHPPYPGPAATWLFAKSWTKVHHRILGAGFRLWWSRLSPLVKPAFLLGAGKWDRTTDTRVFSAMLYH